MIDKSLAIEELDDVVEEWIYREEPVDYGSGSGAIDPSEFGDDMILTFKLSEHDYRLVTEALKVKDKDMTTALKMIIGIE